MTQENAAAVEKPEAPANPQAPAEAGKSKSKSKPKKVRKDSKELDGVRLPLLVEFAYTASTILVILLALAITGISIVNGASLLDLVLRTSVAVMVVGGLLMWVSSQISAGALNATILEQEDAQQPAPEEKQDTSSVEPKDILEA